MRRLMRVTGTLGVVIALAAGVLTSPTLAAKPAGATANAISQPDTVSAGNTAAFNLTFTNNGPSNISTLFLAADTPTGAQFVGTFNGPVLGTSPYGTCPNTGGSLGCSFGAVNAGVGPITLTVVYVVPSNLNGDFTITFHYNSINGLKVLTWSDRGLTYALVSDLEERGQESCVVCHQGVKDKDFIEPLKPR